MIIIKVDKPFLNILGVSLFLVFAKKTQNLSDIACDERETPSRARLHACNVLRETSRVIVWAS